MASSAQLKFDQKRGQPLTFAQKRDQRVERFELQRTMFRDCGRAVATEALLEVMEKTGDDFVNGVLAAVRAAGEEMHDGKQVWFTSCGRVNLHSVLGPVKNCVRLITTRTMEQAGVFATLLPQLRWEEVFVAGGAVIKLVLPPAVVASRAEHWGKSDLDLWASGPEARERAENTIKRWAETEQRECAVSVHGFVTKIVGEDWGIDVIELKSDSFAEMLVETFDIPCCKAWMVERSGLLEITLSEDIASNYMTICPICEIFAPESNRTAMRVLKYRLRGFAITPHYRMCVGCCEKARNGWNTLKREPEASVEGRQAVRTFQSGALEKMNTLTTKTTSECVFLLKDDERQYLQQLMQEYASISELWAERAAGGPPDESDPVYQRLQSLKTRRKDCIVAAKSGTPFPEERTPVLETDFDSADVVVDEKVVVAESDDECDDKPMPVNPRAPLREKPRAAGVMAKKAARPASDGEDDEDGEDGEDDEDGEDGEDDEDEDDEDDEGDEDDEDN